MSYAPGTDHLECASCQHTQPVPPGTGAIVEYPLAEGLAVATRASRPLDDDQHQQVQCDGCGAAFAADVQATRCPYCDSPIVVVDDEREELVPESLVPFVIGREPARTLFSTWARKRWFAPSDFSRRARAGKLNGVYLPHWTYDAEATSRYSGQRGDHYYVTETYRDSEGNTKTRQVRKTRWRSVAGSVHDSFDDVLLCASNALPPKLIDALEPWDLHALQPFAQGYLAGFSAERYQIEVGVGFEHAKERKMVPVIRDTVRRDIGGDEQRIGHLSSSYADVRFKLLLLPLWIASFRYDERVFRFAVNAVTGELQGERPWSKWKIGFAIAAGVALIAAIAVVASQNP